MNSFQILAAFAAAGICYAFWETHRSLNAIARHANLTLRPQPMVARSANRSLWLRMQRLGLAELVGRVNFDPLAPHVAGDTAKAGSDGELWGPYTIEILIVGEADWSKPARDAMRAMQPFRLCTANDPRALWLIPGHQPVNVIVLHNTLTTIELEKTSRLIRHRWPHARILVVRTGDEFLEDALYDDRVLPTVDPATLIATIERLAENGREGRSRHGDQ